LNSTKINCEANRNCFECLKCKFELAKQFVEAISNFLYFANYLNTIFRSLSSKASVIIAQKKALIFNSLCFTIDCLFVGIVSIDLKNAAYIFCLMLFFFAIRNHSYNYSISFFTARFNGRLFLSHFFLKRKKKKHPTPYFEQMILTREIFTLCVD
jgi:hypothetical protein